jgi:hypothetical protein
MRHLRPTGLLQILVVPKILRWRNGKGAGSLGVHWVCGGLSVINACKLWELVRAEIL